MSTFRVWYKIESLNKWFIQKNVSNPEKLVGKITANHRKLVGKITTIIWKVPLDFKHLQLRQGIQRSGAYQRVVHWEVEGTTYHRRHSNGKAGCWAIHHRQKRTWHLVKRILPATFRYDNVWIGFEMSKVKYLKHL